jgi:hypothetical protein
VVASAAYAADAWSDVFVATAGATAALLGLVFVAVSINIERILTVTGLPDRALETLMLFAAPLLLSLAGLFPGLTREAVGGLQLFLAVAFCTAIVTFALRARSHQTDARKSPGHLLVVGLVVVPLLVGGATVLAGAGGGFYWLGAGLLLAVMAGIVNAWVLLVEILR